MTAQTATKSTKKTDDSHEAHKSGNGKADKLTAQNLKSVLWDTLKEIRSGSLSAGDADAVASQAREILRTTNTQLRIAAQSNRVVSQDVIKFAEE